MITKMIDILFITCIALFAIITVIIEKGNYNKWRQTHIGSKSTPQPKQYGTIVINTTDVEKDVIRIELERSIVELMAEEDVIFHVVVEDAPQS